MVFPFTLTRPSAIQRRASVREPRPAFEITRSRVFKGRFARRAAGRACISQSYSIMIGPLRDNSKSETILVRGARQLLTLRGPAGPRRGGELGELGIIPDGAVLIREGKILEAGSSRQLENVAVARNAHEINAA